MSDAKKVLIIDDDVDFLMANQVALEALGFQVLTATDSKRGLELAHSQHADLIILDLMMEKVYSGFSVLQELLSHEGTRDIPIIVVSAVTTETGFRIDEEGRPPEWLKVVDFINKPVDPVELAKKVKAVLEGSK